VSAAEASFAQDTCIKYACHATEPLALWQDSTIYSVCDAWAVIAPLLMTSGHGAWCSAKLLPLPRGEKMAGEKTPNLQDTFLNYVRKQKIPLTIFLVNGVKLQGVVTWFDNFCVLLRRDGHSQLVYKHAISTIMPGAPIQMFEGFEEPEK
jgi:host factor-I protein